jgi:hypothetical protein
MQGSLWINLLRRIPAELHNSLALGLVTGEEVVVQQLIKMDNEFVIVRGRMAGSTAEGRVMVVPYTHLAMIALNKQIQEAEVQAIFGQAAATSKSNLPPPAPPPVEANATPLPKALTPTPGQPKAAPPSKSMLLARLRERLAEKAK